MLLKKLLELQKKKQNYGEDEKNIIDRKIQELKIDDKVKIVYFVPDLRKQGGKYITIVGNLKKINEYNKMLIINDDIKIPINDIMEITKKK